MFWKLQCNKPLNADKLLLHVFKVYFRQLYVYINEVQLDLFHMCCELSEAPTDKRDILVKLLPVWIPAILHSQKVRARRSETLNQSLFFLWKKQNGRFLEEFTDMSFSVDRTIESALMDTSMYR